MKINMTREEALWEALLLWRWIALTGSEDKRDYPHADCWLCGCPLCEYSETAHSCRMCPWPNVGEARCVRVPSPFNSWLTTRSAEDARLVANLMRQCLDIELRRLAQGRTAVAVERQRSRDAGDQGA